MRAQGLTSALSLAVGLGLTWCSTAVVLGDPTCCCPDSPYGDGSDGNVVIDEDTQLTRNMNYRNLTVSSGVTLDVNRYTVRVCERLLNWGTITDTYCGGAGGSGGYRGWGGDPNDSPPGNPKPDWPTAGECGDAGQPRRCAQGGRGGDGGDGGGGGGGTSHLNRDADGGNGGNGGDGGKGGGYVHIYAYVFDNRGVIHADGEDAQRGQDGQDGEYFPIGLEDYAGGGGGGGSGGDGGDGGDVEIRYANLLSYGTIRAQGGSGGGRGYGGDGHCLSHGPLIGVNQGGQPGCGNGGDGGDGEYRNGQCSDDGTNGGYGSDGANVVPDVSSLPMPDTDGDEICDLCDPCTDADGDGWGVDVGNGIDCPNGTDPDCDDANPDVNPGADEDCDNDIDDDCDGLTDGQDPDCPCPCGDINRSGGVVDLQDYDCFGYCYGRCTHGGDCTEEYFECSDMNASGCVDLEDFGLFALWYGKVPTQAVPNCEPE